MENRNKIKKQTRRTATISKKVKQKEYNGNKKKKNYICSKV